MPCDVVIVGAGPAGAIAALVLARAGARVRILERARWPRPKLCGDTLNPGAMRLLANHLPAAAVAQRSVPLDGMLLTGPGGVRVRGVYGSGRTGRAITRRQLDALLIEQAAAAGVELQDAIDATGALTDGAGRIVGVRARTSRGATSEHRASVVIAADGRTSRIARAAGLARSPLHPRRWAAGAYFEGVAADRLGEMHVRRHHYIGISPLPGGLVNACLVAAAHRNRSWGDPGALLVGALRADPLLRDRFARARMVDAPVVLGPLALDVRSAGAPGLLLAGDAAGFIDPITGDGLRFAFAGAELAAATALRILDGTITAARAPALLDARRRAAFGAKWRANRVLRALVGHPAGVLGAEVVARLLPAAFGALVRYAGDCAAGSGSLAHADEACWAEAADPSAEPRPLES